MSAVYPRQNFLIVLIAPSGGGKSTVKAQILESFPQVTYSVSYTTRLPRPGERHGIDYFFVNDTEFETMIARDAFLEHAMVHGHHYGTSAEFVESTIRAGKHVLLDLDVQGALSLRSTVFRTVSVFLLPPSLQELERRLTARGTDSRETIELRLFNARKEIESMDRFDYLVINDDLNRAVEDTAYIIRAEECKTVGYPNIHDIFYGGSAC